MSNVVRAKFRCVKSETDARFAGTKYTFAPMYEADRPEDQRYAKYTPSGELWMHVDNPAVSFAVGAEYYLDLVPVPQEELR